MISELNITAIHWSLWLSSIH